MTWAVSIRDYGRDRQPLCVIVDLTHEAAVAIAAHARPILTPNLEVLVVKQQEPSTFAKKLRVKHETDDHARLKREILAIYSRSRR